MSKESVPENNHITFSLVAGRHHGPNSWLHVQNELQSYGYSVVVHDLKIENPYFSVDDHARVVSRGESLVEADAIWRVGHSWGANVIPRETSKTPVEGLIYVAGAFKPETIRSKVRGRIPKPEHSLTYEVMEKDPNQQAFEEMAAYVFYHDAEEEELEDVDIAVGGLRRHDRRSNEPQLAPYPDNLVNCYVVLENDRALKVSYQRRVAKLLGAQVENLDSGHVPMISKKKSKKLVDIIIGFTNNRQTS